MKKLLLMLFVGVAANLYAVKINWVLDPKEEALITNAVEKAKQPKVHTPDTELLAEPSWPERMYNLRTYDDHALAARLSFHGNLLYIKVRSDRMRAGKMQKYTYTYAVPVGEIFTTENRYGSPNSYPFSLMNPIFLRWSYMITDMGLSSWPHGLEERNFNAIDIPTTSVYLPWVAGFQDIEVDDELLRELSLLYMETRARQKVAQEEDK